MLVIFAVTAVAGISCISGESDAASVLAQIAISISLEGILLVCLLTYLDQSSERRMLAAFTEQLRGAAIRLLDTHTTLWLTSDGSSDELHEQVRLARPQLMRLLQDARSMFPAIAAIDIAHMECWRRLIDLLARICESVDDPILPQLTDEYLRMLQSFRSLSANGRKPSVGHA